jgi:hypothetical protein
MSITSANIQLLMAQLPHLARVAASDQQHPEVQAALTEQLAREAEKRRRGQVQSSEKSDGSPSVRDEDKNPEKRPSPTGRKASAETEEHDESPAASTPWSGNIINTKI